MSADFTPPSRNQRLRQNQLITAGLSLATLLLFVAVGYTSVTRAFSSADFPPTATIPADLGANLAQVSDLAGAVQRRPIGESDPQIVRVGNVIEAGEGSFINVMGLGYVNLSLANRSVLYLDDDSELELTSIEGETTGVLNFGRMLLNSPLPNLNFNFSAPSGARLRASGRMLAGINYDPATDLFTVDCLRGDCELVGANGTLLLDDGQRGEVQGNGAPTSVGAARFDLYQSVGARGIVPTPTRERATLAPATDVPPTAAPTQIPPTATTPVEAPAPTLTATISAEPTITPTVTLTPTTEIEPTATLTPTVEATDTPEATETPSAEPTAEPTESPEPTDTPSADPTATSEPTTPAPTETSLPATETPEPTEEATETPSAEPTATGEPTETAVTPTAAATETPAPTETPSP